MQPPQVRDRPPRPDDARRPRRRRAPRRQLAARARAHRPFLVLLALGVVLRVVTQFAYQPALLYIDSFSYLEGIAELVPGTTRPAGYVVLLLRPLSVFSDLAVYPLAQHLLGLAMGVGTYALLLRRGAARRVATLAAVPVLLDAYQLQIEQNVLSDSIFQALVFAGLLVLTWRPRPGAVAAAVAGLVLGLAVTVRLVGQPLVVPAALFLLFVGGSWRRRVALALVVVVAFALPVAGYAQWYRATHGVLGLTALGARVQYARVAPFADCARLDLPPAQRPLCPTPAQQARLTNDEFSWDPESPFRQYQAPPGTTLDEEARAFVRTVITTQPGDFAAAVGRDFLKHFRWSKRSSGPDEVPVERWHFQVDYPVFYFADPERQPAAAAQRYGGVPPHAVEPLARFLRAYQLSVGSTPGPLLFAALLAGTAGALGVGRARRSGLRGPAFLWTAAGAGLLLASALYEFSWRYQLPGLVLLPVAGGLGLTALRGAPRPPAGDAGPAPPDPVHEAALAAFRSTPPATPPAPQTETPPPAGERSLGPVVLLIAAYDEAESIGAVLDELPDRVCGLHADVVVVVDGATDDTAAVARAHGAAVCDVPVNRGQGAALRLGYRIAREAGAEYVVTLDADGQYDPADIPVVLDPVVRGEADFVTGSRRLGRQQTDDAVRHLGVRVFAWLVSRLTGQRITDTSFGLRAMRAEITGAVPLAQPQYQASELLIGVLARGYRVMERPATMRKRSAGTSKKGGNLWYGLRYGRVVLATWWRERSRKSHRSKTRNFTTKSTP